LIQIIVPKFLYMFELPINAPPVEVVNFSCCRRWCSKDTLRGRGK